MTDVKDIVYSYNMSSIRVAKDKSSYLEAFIQSFIKTPCQLVLVSSSWRDFLMAILRDLL